MNSLTRITQPDNTHSGPFLRNASGLNLFFIALYHLAVLAIQRGGSVELTIGSLRYKIDGKSRSDQEVKQRLND
ncbi:hypothetical protein [Ammoniphilus sp. YIM 78166]|uniref:hypothetical protein n=1 Tax=Ammoniphilus sp. YIM 78166 TaxID=1644106 RepID=UPI00106FE864|nr:hypothetical protein [Ammoniphilus sp. YIM 78166]